MTKFSLFPAFAAVLCAVSLFSCTSSEPDDSLPSSSSPAIPSSSSANVSSSSVAVSSSSSVVQSSSSANVSSSSSAVNNPDLLIKKTITLSNAGSSYADIDGNITLYKQNEIANKLEEIELIAYCGNSIGCENNSIYSPWEIDLFYTYGTFFGSENVFFLDIPSVEAEIFKTATKLSEIESAYNSLRHLFFDEDSYLDEIPIAAGKAFFVYTSDENVRIVIIKTAGNQSVDLEIIQIPN